MIEAIIQALFLYILFFVIITIIFWLIRKVIKKKIMMLFYIIIILSPFAFYLPVEYNTCLYGNEFKDVDINTGFNQHFVYYKVFSIDDHHATLFYVEGEIGIYISSLFLIF